MKPYRWWRDDELGLELRWCSVRCWHEELCEGGVHRLGFASLVGANRWVPAYRSVTASEQALESWIDEETVERVRRVGLACGLPWRRLCDPRERIGLELLVMTLREETGLAEELDVQTGEGLRVLRRGIGSEVTVLPHLLRMLREYRTSVS